MNAGHPGDLRPQSHFRFIPGGTSVPIVFSPLMNMAIKEPGDLRSILLHDYAINMRSSRFAHYEKLYQVVEEAREDCERLRKALAELQD